MVKCFPFYIVGLLCITIVNFILERIWIIDEMEEDYTIVKKTPNLLLFSIFYTFSFSLFALTFSWHMLIVIMCFFLAFLFLRFLDFLQSLTVCLLGLSFGYFVFCFYRRTRRSKTQWEDPSAHEQLLL
jgi:Ca2+/Na+ antiporter